MSDDGWGNKFASKTESGDRPPRPSGCFNCGEEGHHSSDCPQPPKCRRCKGEGHKAADCSQTVTGLDGLPKEIYIPAEIEEDDLFDTQIASGEHFDLYDQAQVEVDGSGTLPGMIKTFSDIQLRDLVMTNVTRSGYKKPTPIQKTGIPLVLGKRDIMACSQTGSGKTAAFLLPIIHFILQEGEFSQCGTTQRPSCLIIAPTRELAVQIKDEARKFSKGSVIKSMVLYGGTSVGYQINQLSRGVDILIATPGRLLDFVSKGVVSLDRVQFFVLDEADRMLDMGFLSDVQRIVQEGKMPSKGERQTLMFSATFPREVRQCAQEFLNDFVFISVGIVGAVNKDVKQEFYQVNKYKKREKLKEVLGDGDIVKTLVFVQTKKNADFLASWLSENRFPTTSIHGDRLQSQREQALSDFRSGKYPILVSTAVAARGLDIKGVEMVVNYDMPSTADEYVHRVGRTGRVGNQGRAVSFYDDNDPTDRALQAELPNILQKSDVQLPEWMLGGGGDVVQENCKVQVTTTAESDEDWD